MADLFICDAVRTPIGRYGGALATVRADDLAAVPIAALMARSTSVDWAAVDDMILGCANQTREDNRNVAQMAALLAGLLLEVGGSIINRLCGSGLGINPSGGAIALGHPLGMSGARLAPTLTEELQCRPTRYGVATMCVGVRQGIAMLLERL